MHLLFLKGCSLTHMTFNRTVCNHTQIDCFKTLKIKTALSSGSRALLESKMLLTENEGPDTDLYLSEQ